MNYMNILLVQWWIRLMKINQWLNVSIRAEEFETVFLEALGNKTANERNSCPGKRGGTLKFGWGQENRYLAGNKSLLQTGRVSSNTIQ